MEIPSFEMLLGASGYTVFLLLCVSLVANQYLKSQKIINDLLMQRIEVIEGELAKRDSELRETHKELRQVTKDYEYLKGQVKVLEIFKPTDLSQEITTHIIKALHEAGVIKV